MIVDRNGNPRILSGSEASLNKQNMDNLSASRRSENMRSIPSRNTGPEIAVRKLLSKLQVRYRLHRRQLPGTPDLSIGRLRIAIFVHGCFWHQHPGCPRAFVPSTHNSFWNQKFRNNARRDAEVIHRLQALGWRSQVIWECETKDRNTLARLLRPIITAYRKAAKWGA